MSGNVLNYAGQVTGTPFVAKMSTYPVTVTVQPGAGTTALVEISTTPTAADNPAGAIWQPWPSGAVGVTTTDALLAPVSAIRISRSSGSNPVKYEVVL